MPHFLWNLKRQEYVIFSGYRYGNCNVDWGKLDNLSKYTNFSFGEKNPQGAIFLNCKRFTVI